MMAAPVFCSDFLVDLITALLLSDKAISNSNRFPADVFQSDQGGRRICTFYLEQEARDHDIQHVFRRLILFFLKDIERAASVKTLIYGFDSIHADFAAQYFYRDESSARIISIRLIIGRI